MMKKLFKLSMVLLIGTVLITACGKYEEGPGFSVLPKKMRITGEYTIDKYVDSDGTETESNDDNKYVVEKDGTYKIVSTNSTIEGDWEFRNDKQDMYIKYTYDFGWGTVNVDETMEIVRLTNKELWLEDKDSGDQVHYIKN